jgi:hypothetical protein
MAIKGQFYYLLLLQVMGGGYKNQIAKIKLQKSNSK